MRTIKNRNMKTTKIIIGLALAFSIISCSKEDSESSISAADAKTNAKLDIMNDDVSKIVEDQLTTSDGISGKTNQTVQTTEAFLPTCATVTRVPAFGTVITPGSLIVKTISSVILVDFAPRLANTLFVAQSG